MKKILIAYIPVLHQGYINLVKLFENFEIYIMSENLVVDLGIDYLTRKDTIRAISSDWVVSALQAWGFKAFEMGRGLAKEISYLDPEKDLVITLPDEDISRDFAGKYLGDREVEFKPIFLRWHRDNVADEKQAQAYRTVSCSEFEKEMMKKVFAEADKSFDWWRQTSAFLVKEDEVVLIAHNEHIPDEQAPYAFGDPRSVFKRGIHVEISTSEHAEARIIAEAACRGISTKGADLFCTDFPCPPCAKLVTRSGIKRLFFQNGYAMLDSEIVLKNSGIEIIFVDIK